MPDKATLVPVAAEVLQQKLACEITLGPLTIRTEASLEQVSALILGLVERYRELPRA